MLVFGFGLAWVGFFLIRYPSKYLFITRTDPKSGMLSTLFHCLVAEEPLYKAFIYFRHGSC